MGGGRVLLNSLSHQKKVWVWKINNQSFSILNLNLVYELPHCCWRNLLHTLFVITLGSKWVKCYVILSLCVYRYIYVTRAIVQSCSANEDFCVLCWLQFLMCEYALANVQCTVQKYISSALGIYQRSKLPKLLFKFIFFRSRSFAHLSHLLLSTVTVTALLMHGDYLPPMLLQELL